MSGRRSHHGNESGNRRQQAPKSARGFARGHGAHHRHQQGKGPPHPMGSGKDRAFEGTRTKNFAQLSDDNLSDLSTLEKFSDTGGRLLENLASAAGFGAELQGMRARGVVIEVRKGNFLTRMLTAPGEVEGVVPLAEALPYAPQPVGLARALAEPPIEQGDSASGITPPVWAKGDLIRTFVRGTLQQFDLGLSSVVAPGDDVELIVPPATGAADLFQHGIHGVLTRVLPRRSEFRRLHPSGRSVQSLAANLDRILIVASTAEPDFRPGFVDRVLVCAAASGLPAALALNKIDLGINEKDAELLNVYQGLNVPVFEVSARRSELSGAGFEALRNFLAGRRSLLTGHSGVGKSSLLLALDPSLNAADIRTGEISAQSGKGAHTTTHGRLFSLQLGGGVLADVIDTPGVREFTPAETDRRNLWGWFPELARLQGQCAFADCTHTIEKGCAVLAAVERGAIHPRRHQSYVRIYQTLPN